MTGLALEAAARVLGVRVGTLKRWTREGCPTVCPGGRGRGRALRIDPDAVRTWRGATAADALALELAGALPQVLAEAAAEAHARTEGPCKREAAGLLAACWYVMATAALDLLRQKCPSVGEINELPEAVARLEKINKNI